MRSTALKQFAKLEATGLWREAPELQRREVIVAFGESSLTISDPRSELALSHWSLPAVDRLNPGELPALYAPGQDALETLELDDALMVEALEKVRNALAADRPNPGRLRGSLLFGASAVIALVMGALLPGALVNHTASMLPPASRLAIGRVALGDLTQVTGLCSDPSGQAALDRLSSRLFGPTAPKIVILREGQARAVHLPGGFIGLHRALIETSSGPEVAAGFALVEDARAKATDPMLALLTHAGFFATLHLLTSGQLEPEAVQGYGRSLGLQTPVPVAAETLLARFGQAQLPTTPYARVVDPSGESVLPLIEADPMARREVLPLMPDADWLSLQAICAD